LVMAQLLAFLATVLGNCVTPSGDMVVMLQHSVTAEVPKREEATAKELVDALDETSFFGGENLQLMPKEDQDDDAETTEEAEATAYPANLAQIGQWASEEMELDEENEAEYEAMAAYQLKFRLSDAESGQQASEAVFQAGERAEVNVVNCLGTGTSAQCVITGTGNVPGTYNIRIPANPEGYQEISNIPHEALKNANSLEAGQEAEVQVSRCLDGGSWAPCTISGPGNQPGTYNVMVADGHTASWQDIPDVPVRALRRRQ